MFENIANFFRKLMKTEKKEPGSKDAAKERLHLVLMQDRANVSADFLELMKQEIIDVIKKYIEVDEKEIDVRLTNKENEDGTNGAPALYANIPILNIKNEMKKDITIEKKEDSKRKATEGKGKTTETKAKAKEKKEIAEKNKAKEEEKKETIKKSNTEENKEVNNKINDNIKEKDEKTEEKEKQEENQDVLENNETVDKEKSSKVIQAVEEQN